MSEKKLTEIVENSSALAEKIEDIFDSEDMVDCTCAIMLVLGKALPAMVQHSVERMNAPHSVPLIETATELVKCAQKVLFHYPAVVIGDDFEGQVMEKIKDFASKLESDDKSPISVPEGTEMDELMNQLFSGGGSDE